MWENQGNLNRKQGTSLVLTRNKIIFLCNIYETVQKCNKCYHSNEFWFSSNDESRNKTKRIRIFMLQPITFIHLKCK